MTQVHVADLDEHEEAPGPALPPSRSGRGKSLLRIGLEVVLITAGVFLGLMGEEWRERAEQRELAQASLRRFRSEIARNRGAVAAVKDYHAQLKGDLDAYFKAEDRKDARVRMTNGVAPIFFDRAAWDLAVATGALTHIDSDLAFELSRLYTIQQSYADIQRVILPTIYGDSETRDINAYLNSLHKYFGDVSYFDPTILKAYDETLNRIDGAVGEAN